MPGPVLIIIIIIIIALVFKIGVKPKQVKVYRFYKPTCPACVAFEPVWTEFVSKVDTSKVQIVNVDTSADPDNKQAKEFNIEFVPTVVGVKKSDGLPIKYNGDRNVTDMLAWVKSLCY